jgi:multidrug efflux pump subunit AcrB
MVSYLIQRPVAVLMTFMVLIITGMVVLNKVPVSLLPAIDVPQIAIRVNYPNAAAATIEENIISPVREGLANIDKLSNIETRAANHSGLINLTFAYGTKMDLAYIEVNEKLDRLSSLLPKDMQRPQVMRINTSDIPVIRLQVIPKAATGNLLISTLAEKILKKRLEQLEGVSLVDINGRQETIISVTPIEDAIRALNTDESIIVNTIKNANREMGGLSVRNGQYRYFVKLQNVLENEKAIAALPVRLKDGTVIPLSRIARVELQTEKQTGYHLYNGKEGLVITIQKQPHSRMDLLVPGVKEAVELFKTDYPEIDFFFTQDQTFLLDAGIDNLKQDILYAGILTVLLLFSFLGNWASPLLMSISIPVSLIITFIFFYLFNISFNIISLSGLALGIGMLIDNSIVVIDNITRLRRNNINMLQSAINGTNEVIAPVISQVLTTVAVYAPLILLSGMAGALVYDQAIALTISLAVSLLVSFILAPLLYRLLLKTSPEKLRKDPLPYRVVAGLYHRMIRHILRYKLLYMAVTILLMPAGIWFAAKIPVSSLPEMKKTESLVKIDWNEPVDAAENLERIKSFDSTLRKICTITEAEVGIQQFLLKHEGNTVQQAEFYYSCKSEADKIKADTVAGRWLRAYYPAAAFTTDDAPNAFTQLFTSAEPFFEARFKTADKAAGENSFNSMLDEVKKDVYSGCRPGDGFMQERSLSVLPDYDKMALYGISRMAFENVLQQQFGVFTISDIKRLGDVKKVRLNTGRKDVEEKMNATISNEKKAPYPLSYFASLNNDLQPKYITADKTGRYRSVIFDEQTGDIEALQEQLRKVAAKYGFQVNFTGQYFKDRELLSTMKKIFLIVLLLLYFILAVQYESLIQPLVVMLTIPLGITGGMFFLWLTGGTLDIMALIGFIVILGLVVDDPILKIETLNRLEKKYKREGRKFDKALLEEMIHQAGDICLKPMLMVSLTTSIAMVPVMFIGGIGNELQRPLAAVIIGGLTIGTFFATWFVPLAYWYVSGWIRRFNRLKS